MKLNNNRNIIFYSPAIFFCLLIGFAGCRGGGEGAATADSLKEGISADSALKLADRADSLKLDSLKKAAPQHIRSKEEIDRFIQNSPDREKYEAGIIPTIARYVPEYASKLLDNTHNGFLIVDKNTMKLYRFDKYGKELERVGIACARNYGNKHSKGDSRTPEGYFTITGIYDSTDWLFTNDDGYTSPARGSFGPRYMRIAPQIGIHGTSSPGSIGGRRSHGCIRMTNDNIMRIHKLCETGMPVIVSPGPKDMAVNQREGRPVPSIPVVKDGIPCVAGSVSAYELNPYNPGKAKNAKDSTAVEQPQEEVVTPDEKAVENVKEIVNTSETAEPSPAVNEVAEPKPVKTEE